VPVNALTEYNQVLVTVKVQISRCEGNRMRAGREVRRPLERSVSNADQHANVARIAYGGVAVVCHCQTQEGIAIDVRGDDIGGETACWQCLLVEFDWRSSQRHGGRD
jgi:hypothetical protein